MGVVLIEYPVLLIGFISEVLLLLRVGITNLVGSASGGKDALVCNNTEQVEDTIG